MTYDLNYNFVWLYFDKFYWGLLLGLELAFVSILIGAAIALPLALVHVDGPAWPRRIVMAYVEFIRNQPLLLLVYLVFYGVPSVGGFKYDPTASFIITLSIYSSAYLVEIFRAGLDAVPRGLQDAAKAIGLSPLQRLVYIRLPTMLRVTLPALSNQTVSSPASMSTRRPTSVAAPMYLIAGYAIFALFRLLERRFAARR